VLFSRPAGPAGTVHQISVVKTRPGFLPGGGGDQFELLG
jgi:hypothetical protein